MKRVAGNKRTAGRQFSPAGPSLYFIASSAHRLQAAAGIATDMLIAVNEIGNGDMARLESYIAAGTNVFIDSGIFNLTNEHMRAHGCTMDEALALPPDRIDGFKELWDRYLEVCRTLGERSWGYIELDQGGRENKIKTRAKLEALGLRPIPVYHPLNDGWDYFDHLAANYDRICFGNVVQAETETRRRLIATAFLRASRYPGLWIHLLGVSPCELTYSCPPHSTDSSTWLNAVRWPESQREHACGKPVGGFDRDMTYNLSVPATDEVGSIKAVRLVAWQARMAGRSWSLFVQRMNQLTGDPAYDRNMDHHAV